MHHALCSSHPSITFPLLVPCVGVPDSLLPRDWAEPCGSMRCSLTCDHDGVSAKAPLTAIHLLTVASLGTRQNER